MEILLAKRPKDKENIRYGETLIGHTECVVKSFSFIFGDMNNETRIKKEWFRFFKLDDKNTNIFYSTGIAACYLHDIGKANNWFQKMMCDDIKTPQAIRHEHLSGLILWNEKIREKLQDVKNIDYDILLSSVIGHHLKAEYETFGDKIDGDVNFFRIKSEAIKELLIKVIKISSDFNLIEEWSYENEGWYGTESLKKYIRNINRETKKKESYLNLLLAIRTAVILADSSGSGLVRENISLEEWLENVFDEKKILKAKDIEEKILNPRIKEIGNKWNGYNSFQNDAEKLSERALLIAPCGSGKTIAAWRWIKGRLNKKPASKVLFLYPTRTTATEGFKDYISWAPEADAALIHGTSEYELDEMFDNVDEEKKKKDFTVEDRLFAIAYWNKRIFSATIDQFLGFMQHNYKSICLLPVMADSVVVIDEVHSFDTTMFSALIVFLKRLNVPVLCMTASLPIERQNVLKECGLKVYPEVMPDDLRENAEYKRYKVEYLSNKNRVFVKVENEMKEKKKILWVVNTVKRCQELKQIYPNAILYHSRYKLDDRKERHKDIIKAFKNKNENVIAITTQVCEMSLDLDADILISEKAPITSLIQRMGRCNRHGKPGSKKQGYVYIYEPEDIKPYDKEDFTGVDEFIKDINKKDVSQIELEKLLEKYGASVMETEKYAAFFEDGLWAKNREAGIREEGDFTVQAILDNEKELYVNADKQNRPGYLVPVPKKYAYYENGLFIADHKRYDKEIGFIID